MRIEPRYWAAWPLLLAASIVMAQLISFRGLALWIGVSVVATWWLTATLLGAGRRLLGLVVGFGMTGLATVVTETLGGSADGPMTRSVLLACGLTVAMLLMLSTRWPLLVLLPGLGLVASALALGGAGRSFEAVGVTTVAVAVSAAMLGPYRGRDLRDRDHLPALGGSLVIIGLAALLVAGTAWMLVASPSGDTSERDVASSAAVQENSSTSATPSTPPTTSSSADEVTVTRPADQATAPVETTPWWVWLLIALAAVICLLLLLALLALLVGAVRRIWVAWRWRRLRRRLQRGSPRDRIAGAWTWARLRRARYGSPLPPSASPDVVAASSLTSVDSRLALLATLAARVAFDPTTDMSMPDSARAWEAADAVGARPAGGWRARWSWAASRPVPDRGQRGCQP